MTSAGRNIGAISLSLKQILSKNLLFDILAIYGITYLF